MAIADTRSPMLTDADRRIVIVGSSCAGKTTLAALIAQARNWPRVELDELYWSTDWTPRRQAEFFALVDAATTPDTWVLAGNYSASRPIVWPRATTIVWLNYSF